MGQLKQHKLCLDWWEDTMFLELVHKTKCHMRWEWHTTIWEFPFSCNILFFIGVMTRKLRLMLLIMIYQLQIFVPYRGSKGTQLYIFFLSVPENLVNILDALQRRPYKCLKTEVYMPSTVWLMLCLSCLSCFCAEKIKQLNVKYINQIVK